MKITYIHHSCFLIEMETCFLLFDYYCRGQLPTLPNDKKLYVFASHRHGDHFHKKIFDLEKNHPTITYILSDDIPCEQTPSIVKVTHDQEYDIDAMKVQTLPSSDEGVAFLITVEGSVIYHAGDLNWWHWEQDNTKEENEEAKRLFFSGIEKLKGRSIDVAFLPVDPRQRAYFYLGFDAFMRWTHTRYAFPMHFWKKYSIIEQLRVSSFTAPYREAIMSIQKENQEFYIEVSPKV